MTYYRYVYDESCSHWHDEYWKSEWQENKEIWWVYIKDSFKWRKHGGVPYNTKGGTMSPITKEDCFLEII